MSETAPPPGGRLWRNNQVDSATMSTRVERIRAARKRTRLSQGELAQRSGISERTINRIETGAAVGERTIRRLEKYLGITAGAPDETDLSQVSALALVTEISRRLDAAERSKTLPLQGGAPMRVRFRTADGPGKRTGNGSPGRVQDGREQG